MTPSRTLTPTSTLSHIAAAYLAQCQARTRSRARPGSEPTPAKKPHPSDKRDRAPLAESTVRRYRYGLQDLGHLADMPIGEILHSQVLMWHDDLCEAKGVAYADASAICLRALFSWCRRRDLCRDNPAAKMRLEHRSEPRIPLTLEQTQAMWRKLEARMAARSRRLSLRVPRIAATSTIDCFRLLLLTAGRRAEIARTRCEHVQISECRIVVPRAKSHPRVIALGPAAVEICKERLAEARRLSDFLFPSPKDPARPIDPNSVWEQVKIISGELGLRGVTPHTLRASLSTWARQVGTPLRVIGDFLGHESLKTTKRFYTVFAVDPETAQLAAAYDGAVRSGREGPRDR